MTDPETGQSKGFGFVTFDTFEAADLGKGEANGGLRACFPIVQRFSSPPSVCSLNVLTSALCSG